MKGKNSMKKDALSNLKFWMHDGIDFENRKILFYNDVDEMYVQDVIKAIMYMEKSSNKPIDIYFSSYGGSVYDGLALCDTMESSKCTIRTHASGKVMSMGLILFLMGKKRYATKRTTFMAHTVSSISWGKLNDMKIEVAESERLFDVCLDILVERTNKTKKWWIKEIEHLDRHYNYKQAKSMGMITHEF